ncbi:TetR/AcrR family transcriptional regulator [Macrococcus animalis]|uniref:TetR/AcrR family transcriptional regulator n=1 Tax=Macrococcus animalis TaxID=3395467 RepID=UPI0039BDEE82
MNTYEKMNIETRNNIENSFIELLKMKSFGKITIMDISKKAQVNRSTFYHHYLDKYDLCEKMIKNMMLQLEILLNKIDAQNIINQMEDNFSVIYCITIFHFIEERKETFKLLMLSDLPFNFEKHLKQLLIKQFKNNSLSVFRDSKIPDNYIANFAASALLGLIEEWMHQNFRDESETVANYFFDIVYTMRSIS